MKLSFIKRTVICSAITLLMTNSATAEGLSGTRFVVSNLFKGNATKGLEVDVTKFGLSNNLFATVGEGMELPRFITLYDIDVSSHYVSFDWVESTFSKKVGGPMPADKHDRNYFIFDLPSGKAIDTVTFDAEKSMLHSGSALPTVKLIAPNKFMTEFSSGVIRKAGFKPYFKISLKNSG